MKMADFIQQDWVKEEIRNRIKYDPETGSLVWKYRGVDYFDKNFAGTLATKVCTNKCGYKGKRITTCFGKKTICLIGARTAWFLQTGDWPQHTVDHINRDSLDDRFENLRDVTQAENNYNKDVYKSNKTGFKGVNKKAGRYWARITHNKITYRLGYHDTPEDAARAYDRKAKELLGDKAILNFPEENS